MEAIQRDYSPLGVKFYYIYKALAHPETNGYVAPFDLQERLLHVKEAQRRIGSQFTWIVDPMTNEIKHALGDAPNSEFVIDPEGLVVRRRAWSNPAQLRKDLEQLVGPVESPTRPQDVNVRFRPPQKVAASGVAPRVQLPGRLRPLKFEPAGDPQHPFYAKLRVEADEQVLSGRQGTLYIGFHLDPLYQVHWNNLAAPLEFELDLPAGASANPASGKGPLLKAPSDVDPREFLIQLQWDAADQPIRLRVKYFACNDQEGWCLPLEQQYTIHRAVDRDGGRRQRGRSGRGNTPTPRGIIRATVTQFDAETNLLELNTRRGPLKLLVTEQTILMLNGRRARPAELQPQDQVMVRARPGDAPREALRIRARRD